MASVTLNDNQNTERSGHYAIIAPPAVVLLLAGMAAAWFAAGSTGLLAHPMRHALTWAGLAVAIVAGWSRNDRTFRTWAILVGGAILGLLLTASTLTTVNVLAVAVVLAAIAQINAGLTGRVALIAALAAGTLGLFRLACGCSASVWLAADAVGWVLGRTVGWLVGSPLEVGATFAGLDFLVLMTAVFVAWLVATAPPRGRRALWAAVAIVVGQFVFLAVLAYSEKLLAALPDVVLPPESENSYVGVSTWSNGLRTLIPWNAPLLAMLIYGTIAGVMFRWAPWLPVIEPDAKELKKRKEKEEKEDIPGSALMADMLFRFGPALLAVAATLLVASGSTGPSDLAGKTIVAYEKGYLNWLKPEYDSEVDGLHGMLPEFVESLGGRFVTSDDLSEQDLATADVLVLLHPDQPWSGETLERIWDYVRRGGSLLVAADPVVCEGDSRSSFNDVLQPTAMRVRYDVAIPRTGNWEQSYEVLAHPGVIGLDDLRNPFGMELASSIRTYWPARPVLVGRWGWSDPGSDAAGTGLSDFNTGEVLGDLVLAAEQPVGRGRVFVLGGTSPLHNEMLARAYPFIGRLLSSLANKSSGPQAPWRQALGLLALVALAALLVIRPAAWQIMLTATVMSVSLICCSAAAYGTGRVLPDGRGRALNNVAYIDASHLEAYSDELWANQGIANLMQTLMRHGYLPLLASDLTAERLERAGLLILIAPAREFSPGERDAVKDFVRGGGTCICTVGAEEARASEPLLADFGLKVPFSPVSPDEDAYEPWPLGFFQQSFAKNSDDTWYVQFFAGWPIESIDPNPQEWIAWSDGKSDEPIVASRSEGRGTFMVVGDTHFTSNENFSIDQRALVSFWRWLLGRVVAGQKEWTPPPSDKGAKSVESVQNDKKIEEDDASEEDSPQP